MEQPPNKPFWHFNLRRFIALSALITSVAVIVAIVLTGFALNHWFPPALWGFPLGKVYFDAWLISDPPGGIASLICDKLHINMPDSVWTLLVLLIGPFWALVIELFIQVRSYKRTRALKRRVNRDA